MIKENKKAKESLQRTKYAAGARAVEHKIKVTGNPSINLGNKWKEINRRGAWECDSLDEQTQ